MEHPKRNLWEHHENGKLLRTFVADRFLVKKKCMVGFFNDSTYQDPQGKELPYIMEELVAVLRLAPGQSIVLSSGPKLSTENT